MFTVFSKAAGYALSQMSALVAAGHMDVAMPPEISRFPAVDDIANIVYYDGPDNNRNFDHS